MVRKLQNLPISFARNSILAENITFRSAPLLVGKTVTLFVKKTIINRKL